MKRFVTLGLIAAGAITAQAETLTLRQFLEDVKSKNPDARAAVESIASFESRQNEAELPLSPEVYAEVMRIDDKKPTPDANFPGLGQVFMQGTQKDFTNWKAGVRKQTTFGLGADLYFNSSRVIISGAPPIAMNNPDFIESSFNLQLKQSLWRNGFGEATRAQRDAKYAETQSALLKSRYQLKTALLNAQNAYWALVSYNQVVKLQQENVDRAKKLYEYMSKKVKMRLYEDTDAMQAQVAFESRDLELQKSLDERAALIRQFNTLRGLNSDEVPTLEELPQKEMMVEVRQSPRGHMTREDFEMMRADAQANLARAKQAKSQIQPQVDLIANFATNGRDGATAESYRQSGTDKYPTWAVGVQFSMPLDLWLVRDLNRGLRQAQTASEFAEKGAQFNETRVWNDLVNQKKEVQGRYERAVNIEKIQTELVSRERRRLLNGRTTTYEAIGIEQNLALAQIQRVKSQLDLLQVHNAIKTFEAKP